MIIKNFKNQINSSTPLDLQEKDVIFKSYLQ